jgi:hypothetical protein
MSEALDRDTLQGCTVKPITPEVVSGADIPDYQVTNDGFLVGVVWIVTLFVFYNLFSGLIPGLIFATLATYFSRNYWRNDKLKWIVNNKNEVLLLESIKEAERTTSSLVSTYKESFAIFKRIEEKRNILLKTIAFARSEFDQTAYSSFWDSVELGLTQLANCHEEVRSLSRNAKWYKEELINREHSFPPFPITPEMLPNFQALVQELYAVIRLGETNINFSLIYEQIKTRQVLIQGFGNLEGLIKGLGRIVQSSVEELKDTLDRMRK